MIYKKLPNAASTVLSVGTTAGTLQSFIETAASASFDVKGLDGVDFNIESGSLRVMFDGNTPTTSFGLKLEGFCSFRKVDLTKVSIISTSGTLSVSVQVGRSLVNESGLGQTASSSGGGGSGDVTGPASSTDNAFARFDGTGGKTLQNSQTTEDDNGVVKALAIGTTQQDRSYRFFTDFENTDGMALSGFVQNNQYETADYRGFIRTSNAAFCYAVRSLSTVGGMFIGGGEITIDIGAVIKALADATNDYVARIGLFDDVAAAPQNGVYVRYQRATGTWSLVSIEGGVSTVVSTGIVPTADDHEKFTITINAGATSISGTANGSAIGTAITTNIPTGVRLMEGVLVERLAGSTNSAFFPDWYGLNKVFTNNRFTS